MDLKNIVCAVVLSTGLGACNDEVVNNPPPKIMAEYAVYQNTINAPQKVCIITINYENPSLKLDDMLDSNKVISYVGEPVEDLWLLHKRCVSKYCYQMIDILCNGTVNYVPHQLGTKVSDNSFEKYDKVFKKIKEDAMSKEPSSYEKAISLMEALPKLQY